VPIVFVMYRVASLFEYARPLSHFILALIAPLAGSDLIANHYDDVNSFRWEFNQLHCQNVRVATNDSRFAGRSNTARIILPMF